MPDRKLRPNLPGDARKTGGWLRPARKPQTAPVNNRTAGTADKATDAHARKPLFRSSSEAYSKGDKILFTSGIGLSLVCAFFPWYVFLNQDQFGVRTVQLGDIPASGRPIENDIRANRAEDPQATGELAGQSGLDILTTGTLPDKNEKDAHAQKTGDEPREQPFPRIQASFSLVHVANGRAMFEDESGLFVVQRDSVLPDSTRVMSIEQRAGLWVVVTSSGRVIELAK